MAIPIIQSLRFGQENREMGGSGWQMKIDSIMGRQERRCISDLTFTSLKGLILPIHN